MDILKNVGVAISTTERRKAHWDKLCVNYDENTPDGALKGVRRIGKVPKDVKDEGIKKNNPLYKSKLNNLNRYCEF